MEWPEDKQLSILRLDRCQQGMKTGSRLIRKQVSLIIGISVMMMGYSVIQWRVDRLTKTEGILLEVMMIIDSFK